MKRIKLLSLGQNQQPALTSNPRPLAQNQNSLSVQDRNTVPLPNLTVIPTLQTQHSHSDVTSNPPIQAQNPQPVRPSQLRISLRLLSIVVVIATSITLVLLNNFRILPYTLVVIATSVYQVISGFALLSAILVIFLPKDFWKSVIVLPRKTQCILAISCIFILIGFPTPAWQISLAASPPSLCSSKLFPSPVKLIPNFEQPIPNYNNPDGVVWYVHKDTLVSPCTSGDTSGLVIQQISKALYAEVDLQQINHKNYDQTNFSAQTAIKFIKPDDPANPATLAGLLVQTPAPTTLAGGFAFLLNAAGQWQLKQWDEGDASRAYDHVVASGYVTIDVQQPVTLQVRVQHGILYGDINGKLVISYRDDLPKLDESWPREIGLVVEFPLNAPSSQVLFSHFVLG